MRIDKQIQQKKYYLSQTLQKQFVSQSHKNVHIILSKKQIVSIHIGYGGIQLAQQLYYLFAQQLQIKNGKLLKHDRPSEGSSKTIQKIFRSTNSYQEVIARCLLIDTDDQWIENFTKEQNIDVSILFDPKNIITANVKGGVQRNFAQVSKMESFIKEIKQKVQKQVDKCDQFGGFLVYHMTGGGTSAGVVDFLLQYLKEKYPRKHIVNFAINPDIELKTQKQKAMQCYNAAVTYKSLANHSDTVFCFDNSKLRKICQEQLQIYKPTESQINKLLCHCISTITQCFRFDDGLNVDICQFSTTKNPQQFTLKFMTSYYAPIKQKNNYTCAQIISTNDIFEPLVYKNLCFSDYEPFYHKNLSAHVLFRGDISNKQANSTIMFLKNNKHFRFIDWAPTGFKCCLIHQPVTYFKPSEQTLQRSHKEGTIICNNAGIMQSLNKFFRQFEINTKEKIFWQQFSKFGFDCRRFDTQILPKLNQLQRFYEQFFAEYDYIYL